MTYEQVIFGLQALQASDFDYNNVDARGWEKLHELTDALLSLPSPERAIPELFAVMERMPDADLGSPGPLVHTLERLAGYEDELAQSVTRCPSLLSVWMVNRILNTELTHDARRRYVGLLNHAANDPHAPKTVRDDARDFIDLQTQRRREQT